MRARLAQYANDIVSLTILALMSIALIAGQADATQRVASESTEGESAQVLVIDIDPSFRQESE